MVCWPIDWELWSPGGAKIISQHVVKVIKSHPAGVVYTCIEFHCNPFTWEICVWSTAVNSQPTLSSPQPGSFSGIFLRLRQCWAALTQYIPQFSVSKQCPDFNPRCLLLTTYFLYHFTGVSTFPVFTKRKLLKDWVTSWQTALNLASACLNGASVYLGPAT